MQGQADRAYAQEWTAEEQKALEAGIKQCPASMPALERHLRISMNLPNKGVRDVALRVLWMQRFARQKRQVSGLFCRSPSESLRSRHSAAFHCRDCGSLPGCVLRSACPGSSCKHGHC